MNLESAVRDLIAQELNSKEEPTLALIARKVGVSYKKLWYFYRATPSKKLSAEDAQKAYEILSGQPLLPTTDV